MTFYTACSSGIFAGLLGFVSGCTISKQAVSKKISKRCTAFFRRILFDIVLNMSDIKEKKADGVFSDFGRVLIQDSTCIRLPAKLADAFPGPRNQTGKKSASLKIQAVYDALSETFVSFDISSYTDNDQKNSPEILKAVVKNDLILRDLGYFSTAVLAGIDKKEAFFLTRYFLRTDIYDKNGEKINLLNELKIHGKIDINILLGSEEMLPVRLVAVPVPEETANSRRRKLRKGKSGKRTPSEELLKLQDWEIFITNVGKDVWNSETVCSVYGVRWRIETIFKTWKSHFNFTAATNGSEEYIETLIYAKLISVTLFQTVFFGQLSEYTHKKTGNHLSMIKTAQFLQQHITIIFFIILSGENPEIIIRQILKHCTYDKRKKRLNYAEIFTYLSSLSLS